MHGRIMGHKLKIVTFERGSKKVHDHIKNGDRQISGMAPPYHQFYKGAEGYGILHVHVAELFCIGWRNEL